MWALDPTRTEAATFINSRICDFVDFLGIYMSLYASRPKLNEINDADARAIVNELRARFSALDPRALDDVGTWWSLVLEQAEQGLF